METLMSLRFAALPVAAICLGVLAGCGSSSQFAHATEIVAALEEGGLVCPSYSPTGDPVGAAERGACWPEGKDGNNLIVSTYATQADAKAAAEGQRKLGVGVDMLTGDNWTLAGGTHDFLAKAKEILGGDLIEEKAK